MTSYLEVWRPGGPVLVPLVGDRMTVGRHPDCDVVVDHDPSVSRRHASFDALAGGWCVQDLGSSMGTSVSGRDVVGTRALREGDELRLGHTRIVYRTGVREDLGPTVGVTPPPPLTPRERDVLVALCRPLLAGAQSFSEPASMRQIAEALVVSEAAVKQHLVHLYEKFRVAADAGGRRRVGLANEAIRRNAVSFADLAT